jgi:pimeloyl-[acyl-carrier protein] synthase
MIAPDALSPQDLLHQFRTDPYPLYRQLRQAGTVVWVPALDRWVVTGHAEVLEVLKSGVFRVNYPRWQAQGGDVDGALARTMLTTDPPDHTRLRTLVTKAFTPRTVERLRPQIEAWVDRALDEAQARGSFDLIEDIAHPLPVTVIAEMLGVPPEDRDMFRAGSDAIAAALDPIAASMDVPPADPAADELREYLAGAIAQRRGAPRDDLISELVQAEEGGDRLNADELLQMCVLLLVAGHETTVNLIGNGVNTLLDRPEAARRLREEPDLIETGVEELLRFDSPVQLTGRFAAEPAELGGQRIAAGEFVMPLLGAANHDPSVFAEPSRLDVARHPNPHIAFGRGIHFCVGSPLARLEGRIAIGRLLRRFPTLERHGEPRRRPTITLRGFASLPVRAG